MNEGMREEKIQIEKNECKFVLGFSKSGHIAIHCEVHSGFKGGSTVSANAGEYYSLDSKCEENLRPFLKKLAELIQNPYLF
jgi:hypothetical protein